MFNIGQHIKTRIGSRENPEWAYGRIVGILDDDGYVCAYEIEWDGGGYDVLGDDEIEPA